MNGSVAIFIDVANLTAGTGASVVSELRTSSGDDGMPGRFRLATILDRIESYAKTVSAAPRGPRWAVNFPKASPAVTECNAKDYSIENIPKDLWEKGDDDRILIEKITDIERGYPMVNHFVLVLGDKGYRIKAESLLRNGKSVHIISPARSLAGRYDRLAADYPEQMRVITLEELIEPPQRKT
jgi:NYN domain